MSKIEENKISENVTNKKKDSCSHKKENNNEIVKLQEQIELIKKNNKSEIDKLLNSFNEERNSYKKKIDELNKRIELINMDFVDKVNKKSAEAKKILDQKINEMSIKCDKSINNIKKFGMQDSFIELIKIINQFNSIIKCENDDPKIKNFLVGFKMFSTLFSKWLAQNNMVPMSIQVGDEFNSEIMEAVEIETNPKQENNCVERVIEDGYKLYDRVILHAKVVVAKKTR